MNVNEPALILLAEDDPAMRTLLATMLTRTGFEVVPCADGNALLRELRRSHDDVRPPSLIVSDVQMPGATGLDVVHESRRIAPSVPVILITAFGDERTHRRAKQLGAAAVLNKPFDLGELRALIVSLTTGTSPAPSNS